MGTITTRHRKGKPSNYQASVRITGMKSASCTFDDKDVARRWIGVVEPGMIALREASPGKQPGAKPSPEQAEKDYYATPLKSAVEEFCASRAATERDRKSLRSVVDSVEAVAIGGAGKRWMRDHIDKMLGTESKHHRPYAPATVADQVFLMEKACQWLAERRGVEEPKLHFVTKHLPKGWRGAAQRDRRLTPAEREALASHLGGINSPAAPHWSALLLLSIETGARLQEVVGARWSEFHLADQVWTIPAGRTKGSETRTVAVSRPARETVASLRAMASPKSNRVLHMLGTPNSVSKGFRQHAANAGIEGLSHHDLRHEAISLMFLNKKKASIRAIMEMVGHKTYEMVRRYSHLRPEEFVGLLDD